MDCHFRDLPIFPEFRDTINAQLQQHMRQHIPAFNQLQRNLSANDMPGL